MDERDEPTPPKGDPWLTLAEIAAELRVNPATVRLWVSKGLLPATRAGERKWLVRRSDLDRMLATGAVGEQRTTGAEEPLEPNLPPPSLRERSALPESRPTGDRHAQLRTAIERVQLADRRWTAALQATQLAPPAPGFASRVRDLADAAEQEAAALQHADEVGLGWTPAPNQQGMIISNELRPSANRPGPAELWESFDAAVRRLGVAQEGVAMSAVARGFADLSEAARAIADELDADDAGASTRKVG